MRIPRFLESILKLKSLLNSEYTNALGATAKEFFRSFEAQPLVVVVPAEGPPLVFCKGRKLGPIRNFSLDADLLRTQVKATFVEGKSVNETWHDAESLKAVGAEVRIRSTDLPEGD